MADEFTISTKSPFAWIDTPWIVAALLGAWGVFMGMEEFYLADLFMALAGFACVGRLRKDTLKPLHKRWWIFFLGLSIIVSIVGVDIWLTAKKKTSTDAKNQEVPRLTRQIEGLKGTIIDQQAALSIAQAQSAQQLKDIGQQNGDLKKSIEAKDAALESIAKDQYALNFTPQVSVIPGDSFDSIAILNNGKTNITIEEWLIEGKVSPVTSSNSLVVPAATLVSN